MTYILYNPKAGDGDWKLDIEALTVVLDGQVQALDIAHITNYTAFLRGIGEEDVLILAGGDGTVNRFRNDTRMIGLPRQILYYPIGRSNILARSLGKGRGDCPFPIREELEKAPAVQVQGKDICFLTGIGCGLCGWQIPGKKTNPVRALHRAAAHCGSFSAHVCVDGVRRSYSRVWMAPVMWGQHCRSLTGEADQAQSGQLSIMILHGCGRMKLHRLLNALRRGKQARCGKNVEILTGREITVELDRPVPAALDGESLGCVSAFTAKAPGE